MAHRLLRCLAGLPPGAAFAFDRRLTLGRAVDCDVQLVDASVSRHHAKIEVEPDGSVVLIDLASRSGTRVDNAVVDRMLLHHGAIITIAGFKLRFEESTAPATERRTRRVGGMDALRVTASFEPPRMMARGRAAAAAKGAAPPKVVEPPTLVVPPTVAPPTVAPPTVSPPTRVVEPPEASRVSRSADTLRPDSGGLSVMAPLVVRAPATDPSSPTPQVPDATLVRAVVELRRQELHAAQPGEPLLGTEPAPGRRQYPRFRCTMRGWLARRDADKIWTRAVAMRDLAFGGACVEWTDEATQLDPKMWLVLDLEEDATPMVVLPSRLVWAQPSSRTAGLAFVGPAGTGLDALELIRML